MGWRGTGVGMGEGAGQGEETPLYWETVRASRWLPRLDLLGDDVQDSGELGGVDGEEEDVPVL